MKAIKLLFVFTLISFATYSQTYKSSYSINKECDFQTDMKSRTITISDKEISISNFADGGTETIYFVVNKIEEKEYSFDGLCKYYYCTTKDKDPINGYQKAIFIKKYDAIYLGLFASEIDINNYEFSISKY